MVNFSDFLHDYLKIAKRFWWILLIAVLVYGMLVPVVSYAIYTPEYKATCSFTVRVVNNSVTESLYTQYDIYYDKDLAEQLDKTFSYILTSDHLADEVRQELDRELESGRIKAKCIEGSNLFTLTVMGDSAKEAYDLLVTIIEVFPQSARYVVSDLVLEILEEPTAQQTPSNAVNLKLMAAAGAALGFILGSCLLVYIMWSKRTVRKPEELEEVLNMSCLGIIPVTRERTKNIIEGEFRESIRGVSRKIESAMEKDHSKVLLITGTTPGEGKSLLSRYIAQTLAEWGKRVCLVDCDLRSPSLYKQFKFPDQDMPLQAYLEGNASRKSVLLPTKTKGLTLLGNTQSVSNPTILLHSDAMKNLMQQLKADSDYVILDAPPCDNLSDVTVLREYADQMLYVVRQEYAPLEQIVDAVQDLSAEESHLLGFVLNFAEKTASGYGKYGYGAYSYGKYGNGYYGKYGHYGNKYHYTEQAEGPSTK